MASGRLFSGRLGGVPEASVAQDRFDGVGTEEWQPAIGFGKFVGQALLAPLGMRLAQRDDLLSERLGSAAGVFGSAAGKVLQSRIPAFEEARFPGVKGASPNMGGAAGQFDIATRFPGLEQQSPLLSGRQRKVDTFVHSRTA